MYQIVVDWTHKTLVSQTCFGPTLLGTVVPGCRSPSCHPRGGAPLVWRQFLDYSQVIYWKETGSIQRTHNEEEMSFIWSFFSPVPFPVKLHVTLGQVKEKSKEVTSKGIGMNPPRVLWEFEDTKERLLILACLSRGYGGLHCRCILFPLHLSVVL